MGDKCSPNAQYCVTHKRHLRECIAALERENEGLAREYDRLQAECGESDPHEPHTFKIGWDIPENPSAECNGKKARAALKGGK